MSTLFFFCIYEYYLFIFLLSEMYNFRSVCLCNDLWTLVKFLKSLFFPAIHSTHSYIHTVNVYTCARGVMVIVAGYGHGDASSNPGRDWLHFT